MENSILYINDNEVFGITVIENLNHKLVFGKLVSGKTFVAKLVGRKDSMFIFTTRDGNLITNNINDIVAIRDTFQENAYLKQLQCPNPRSGDPHGRHRSRGDHQIL